MRNRPKNGIVNSKKTADSCALDYIVLLARRTATLQLESQQSAQGRAHRRALHALVVQAKNLTTSLRREHKPCAAVGAQHAGGNGTVGQSDGVGAVVPDIVLAHDGDANRWP